MAIAATCPKCGHTTAHVVNGNTYECDHEEVWFETVYVPDQQRMLDGTPGLRPEHVRRTRVCGHRFDPTSAGFVPVVCDGRLSHSPCGLFAAGVCQGEGCGSPTCSTHGTMVGGRLFCERCKARVDSERREREAAERRAHEEREAAHHRELRANLQARLTQSPDHELIPVLRAYASVDHRDNPSNALVGHRDEFAPLVVDAWRRYVTTANPAHDHDLVVLRDYRVPKEGRSRRAEDGVVSREPCWVRLVDREVQRYPERVSVHHTVAYTATHAYEGVQSKDGGDWGGFRTWGRWTPSPTLNGLHVVNRGVAPQWVRGRHGQRSFFHCQPLQPSRPIEADDVLHLAMMGHQAIWGRGDGNPYGVEPLA